MMESLQKIANRISTGVIVAALVIGGALTSRMQNGPMLFGLPILAVLFIAVATVLGLGLIVSALRRDGKVERAANRPPD
jgi:hypothetical protein